MLDWDTDILVVAAAVVDIDPSVEGMGWGRPAVSDTQVHPGIVRSIVY